MLDVDEARACISRLWSIRVREAERFRRIDGHLSGERGGPVLPDDAGEDLKALARYSRLNILALVRDVFAQNLSCVGFRDADAETDHPAWAHWQRNRMDARQALVYRWTVAYGAAYVALTMERGSPVFVPRSPKRMVAVYRDPESDTWPQFAFEVWEDNTDGVVRLKGRLLDDEHVYPVDLGSFPAGTRPSFDALTVRGFEQPYRHGITSGGAGVTPVVRYALHYDDGGRGEVEPLFEVQRAINSVAFDRLLVSRTGAHPQKAITGWSGTKEEVLRASAARVWTFKDPDVRTSTFAPAALEPYTGVIESLVEHAATVAQISPSNITGKLVNVPAEAVAAAQGSEQRKVGWMRRVCGEAHEQLLLTASESAGEPRGVDDSSAEAVWENLETRPFGAVVDGVTKLAGAGVPVAKLLSMVPGMTQQQIRGVEDGLAEQDARKLTDLLITRGPNGGAVADGADSFGPSAATRP